MKETLVFDVKRGGGVMEWEKGARRKKRYPGK